MTASILVLVPKLPGWQTETKQCMVMRIGEGQGVFSMDGLLGYEGYEANSKSNALKRL